MFGFWRFIFIISQIEHLDLINYVLYIKSFWIALRLDLVVISYLFIPIIFLSLNKNIYIKKYFVKIYLYILAVLYSLIMIADIEFFNELGTHLNLLVMQPNARSKELWQFAWYEYPIITYLLCIFSFIFFWTKFINQIISFSNSPQSKLNNLFFFCLNFILVGTFIRGGWQERPIDWGHAMFSKNQMANQIALNPIFNLGRSIIQLNSEKNLSESMKYMDTDTASLMTKEMILKSNESYVNSNSITRIINKPNLNPPQNIVLIILESFLADNCGFINKNKSSITPNLNKIADNGINFSNVFASGKRSAFGLSSILCSWPSLPGFPLISQLESQGKIETLATLLKKNNFSTYFLFGGDADFDNMKGFLKSNGYDKIIERQNFNRKTPGTMWGVFDEYLFNYAENILDSTSSKTLLTIFTITNHQPWNIPKDKEDMIPQFSSDTTNSKVLRTMYYTDYVIGEFMNQNKDKEWFDNTLFIFISDHGIVQFNEIYEDPRNAHIPFLIYSSSLLSEPKVVHKIASQADIVPTLLHLIGYNKEFNLMGSNILAEDYDGFALRIVNDYIVWFESNYIYTEIINQGSKLYQYNNIYETPYILIDNQEEVYNKIQNNMRAYLQTAYYTYKKMY